MPNHLQIVKTVFIVKIVLLKRKVNSGIMSQKRWSLKEKTKLRSLTRRSHFIKAAQYQKFYRVLIVNFVLKHNLSKTA